MKTLRQLLKEGEQRLLENQIENGTMEARYLLEYICDLNWAQYLLQADTVWILKYQSPAGHPE